MESRLLRKIEMGVQGKLEVERKKNKELMIDLRRSYPF